MGWLGIIIAIGFVCIWLYWSYKGWYYGNSYAYEWQGIIEHDSWCYTIFWGVPYKFFTCLIMFICVLLLCSITPNNPSKINGTYSEPIYSIGTNSSVSGHFVLGSGNVEGYPTYRYFVKRGGAYQIKEIKADRALIYEEENGTPRVVEFLSKYYTGPTTKFKKAVFGENEGFWRSISMSKSEVVYHIYLPKGSIIQTYELRP